MELNSCTGLKRVAIVHCSLWAWEQELTAANQPSSLHLPLASSSLETDATKSLPLGYFFHASTFLQTIFSLQGYQPGAMKHVRVCYWQCWWKGKLSPLLPHYCNYLLFPSLLILIFWWSPDNISPDLISPGQVTFRYWMFSTPLRTRKTRTFYSMRWFMSGPKCNSTKDKDLMLYLCGYHIFFHLHSFKCCAL